MSFPEESNSQSQEGRGGGPAGEGKGQAMAVYWATDSKLRKMKCFWRWTVATLYNDVNVLNATIHSNWLKW